MGVEREPPVTVVACGNAVLVTRPGQEPITTSIDAWRQLIAEVKAGRWDRPA
jgi:hypothetical protein